MCNRMLYTIFIFLTIHVLTPSLFSQADGGPFDMHFYLLTYSPGKELYSTFGHSSIRYVNRSENIDIVYNYGTFDFDNPDFYINFIKGKLNYQLSRVHTSYVFQSTKYENRCLYQNEMQLSGQEKIALINALEENYLPENRYYRYEFLYDNCATRITDLIDSITNGRFNVSNKDSSTVNFNKYITSNLELHPWANFGFSFITGWQVLKNATFEESQFLPQYLLKYLSTGYDSIAHQNLLDKQVTILSCNKTDEPGNRYFYLLFILLLIFWSIIKVLEKKKGFEYRIFDWIIFFPSTVLGFMLLTLWAISEHQIFAWNYNLLWANPILFILLVPKYKYHKVINISFFILFLLSIGLTILLKGFYLPVIVIILLQALRLKIKPSLFPNIF